ncbi:MAG: NAD(P)/FAD-dependent oxidoreductase [Thiothrix sp.]|nr:MAG: NAD(P)/FAD-dependent oxidoreductase [Thiothrix sp.]
MQHVIIGAGPAGVVAAETLRKADADASITIVGDEMEPPYSRMAIPYYLTKKIQPRGTHLRSGPAHYQSLGIELKNARVTRVDGATKSVILENDSELKYDKLLIAAGSRPATPPIPGVDLPHVHACWTLTNARQIAALAKPNANVVLMGAGFIGCIILEALALRGVNLTVIEMGDRMVPRMMNNKAGNLIKSWCLKKGVAVRVSTKVTAITSEGVELENGEKLPAELVISATGVTPNIEFLKGSNIKIDQGILVDTSMQTNLVDVYAAGDIAQGKDFSTGECSVQAIQPTATEHGRIAALNMSDKNVQHQGSVNMNVLDTLGLISSSFGLWMGVEGGESGELYHPEDFKYLNLQFRDDLLIGASAVGLTQHIGVLRGLIQSEIHLGNWKDKLLVDPTRIMEAYLASTQEIGFAV